MAALREQVHFRRNPGLLKCEVVSQRVFHGVHRIVLRLQQKGGRCVGANADVRTQDDIRAGRPQVARVDQNGEVGPAAQRVGGIHGRIGSLREAGTDGSGEVPAGVLGVLRVNVLGAAGRTLATGGLDAGYPLPGRGRQAKFPLPRGTDWKGLRVTAQIEVRGQRYPVRWACRQALDADGALRLQPTPGID